MTPNPDFERPDLVSEYIASLQDQLDALRSRNERLRSRVEKLEAERDRLTELVPRRRRRGIIRQRVPPSPDSRSLTIPSVGTIPELDLPLGPITRPDLRVAAVLDEFSRAAFSYEFTVVDVPAVGWADALEAADPHLLLVESAYRGHDGGWAGKIARFGRPSSELAGMVEWCRARGIVTAFWNKEDPINHDWFAASAPLFDLVLTVDSRMVDVYRRKLDHRRIAVMQFAAQPAIHHPGSYDRSNRVAFAGTYYAAKHPQRQQQLETLLDSATPIGLDIFDRIHRPGDPRFAWPERFTEHIVGSLTYPQTLDAYRRYPVFINVNTVTDSPTMCARRVYELLASRTHVVSGPALALRDVPVFIADDTHSARSGIERALELGENVSGMQWIADGNTMSDRVEMLLALAF